MSAETISLTQMMRRGLGVPIGLLLLLCMIVLPLKPFLLDILFTFNITLSLLVLLAGIYTLRPLDFAVFPTIILISTLLRLALNVASTRVVLLNGHTGSDAAGQVIESFGQVVIGGNYTVGLVVFTILVIINFVVVTKGAGRISEVSARFTLDALPGKQMAIDADLNAGIIDQKEAKVRREEVSQEADFYGAMDGASKFVRGDAIAGILILLINIVGGVLIGAIQHEMSLSEAMQVYALLTIGDGLAAQIPSLILSTAAAIMVTRVSKAQDMSSQMISQVFKSPKPLLVSGAILIGLGIIPGMPHVAFGGLGGILIYIASIMNNKKEQVKVAEKRQEAAEKAAETKQQTEAPKELDWEDVPPVDTIGLEIGYRLIPLVDKAQNGELMTRIKGVRKKLSQELGFLIPTVHIRDNLDLPPNAYRVSISGVTCGESDIQPDKDLAINPGQVFGNIPGVPTKDPSFGLDALWISKQDKDHAQTLGYTVVDASTVIATHISQILNSHANQLLGHEEVQKMLDHLAKTAPKLVEDLIPQTLALGTVLRVMQNLLHEQIPVRDIRTIAEILTDYGQKTQDANELTQAARIALGPLIVQQVIGFSKELPVITLAPSLEQILHKSMQATEDEGFAVEPSLADRMQTSIKEACDMQEMNGLPSVLLVPGPIRPLMSRFVRSITHNMAVLSYQEIPEEKQVKVVATIGDS